MHGRTKQNSKKAKNHAEKVRSGKLKHLTPGEWFEKLVAVQARLRAPKGCPWDREQTHQTLRTYLLEEAYEVLEALDTGNDAKFAEEMGDLLLQIVFHSQIAQEEGRFTVAKVIREIHDKMIRRHPHVFGNVKAETSSEVLKNWAQLKAKEKRAVSRGGEAATPSALDGVPRSLPALLEAYQLTRRAAQVGFDWQHAEGILEKINEEIAELRSALAASQGKAIEEEVGDILFSVVNLARFLELDPEVILKQSNLKFKMRFQEMEAEASRSGQRLSQLSKETLEILWDMAKVKSREDPEAES